MYFLIESSLYFEYYLEKTKGTWIQTCLKLFFPQRSTTSFQSYSKECIHLLMQDLQCLSYLIFSPSFWMENVWKEEWELPKFEYLKNQKSSLVKWKAVFINFKVILLVKYKKIAVITFRKTEKAITVFLVTYQIFDPWNANSGWHG